MTRIKAFTLKNGNTSIDITKFSLDRDKKYFLDTVIYARSHYTIMTGVNDTFVFTVSPTQYTATLTQGNYTTSSLATELETQLNSAYTPDNNFSVSFSSLTQKYTISHSSASFTVDNTSTLLSTIGFVSTNSAATSQSSTNIYNLNYCSSIVISSNDLALTSKINNNNTNLLYIIDNVSFGSINSIKISTPLEIMYNDDSQIDIKLLFNDDSLTQVPTFSELTLIIREI